MIEEKTKKIKKIKDPKKRRMLFIILGIIAIIIIIFAYRAIKAATNVPTAEVVGIVPTDISQTISSSGIVESTEIENITTIASYKVDEVLVKEGDKVKEGDILAQLSPDDLNVQLEQLRASVGKAQSSANHSTNVAKRGLEETEDSSVETYEKQVEKLEADLMTANETLDEAMMNYRLQTGADGENWIPMIPGEEDATVKSAKNRADQAERARDAIQKELESSRIKLQEAQDGDLKEIKSAEDSLKGSEIQGNLYSEYLQIKELEKKIEDTTIKATKDGVVTLVNVKTGQQVTGLMFVVENLDSYKIETNVGEYNINSIAIGSDVVIKSEATGDKEYKGKISAISPTANKAPDGSVAKTNIQFGVTIDVLDKDEDLKVGMNARLTIIISEKKGALTVPFNAIRTNAEGKDFIYVVTPPGEGGTAYVVREVVVEIGIESDLDAELVSGDYKEGDLVILNPDMVYDGMAITPQLSMIDGGDGMFDASGGGMVAAAGGHGTVVVG